MLPIAFLLALRLSPETPDVPLRQPQLAAVGDTVVLSYGAGTTIYFTRSTDGGKSFAPPVKVAEARRLAIGSHRGPRIAIAGRTLVITAIAGESQPGDLYAWRSSDNGRTWSTGVRVNDLGNSAREGLHATAAASDGTVWAVWLDLRAEGTQLFGALSKDGGATWAANQKIYASPSGSICECCHPTAHIGPQGELYAMWRNWLDGSRDMYVAASKDGRSWQTQRLGQGSWPLNACPMDGGGLAVDKRSVIHSAWRRGNAVYVTSAGGPEVRIGAGKNPAIAIGSDGPYFIWTEGANVKVIKPGSKQPVILGAGAFPVLAGAAANVYAAWEHEGAIAVERVR